MITQTIFERTEATLNQWLDASVSALPVSPSIGIFGDNSFARYIAKYLLARIECELCFLSSAFDHASLDGIPVCHIQDARVQGLDVIFSGSMAAPEAQRKVLEEYGVSAPFFAVKGGKYLCTEPRFDHCDVEKLSSLKNKHQGDTIYVIGNGPSLNDTPPELLVDGVTMGGNGILLKEHFVPDYYFLLDKVAFEVFQERVCDITSPIIAPAHLYDVLGHLENALMYHVCYQTKGTVIDPVYSGIASGHTIVSPMIQFATYMGAKRIVLLGVDNNYSKISDKRYHFHRDYYKDIEMNLPRSRRLYMEDEHSKGIIGASERARLQGVEIFDATPVENNLGLPKIDFESISG